MLADPEVTTRLTSIILLVMPLSDKLAWAHSTDGLLTGKESFSFLRPVATSLSWADRIWKPCIPASHSFIFWRLMHRNMPTDENLWSCGCLIVSVCILCMSDK